MYSIYKSTTIRICILIGCLLLLGSDKVEAAGKAAARVINTSGGQVNVAVKNISDDQPAAGGLITWSNIEAGLTGWKAADQYLEISHSDLSTGWGIQFYTDNEDGSANPKYTGSANPAGLIKTGNTSIVLPMAWRMTDSLLSTADLEDIQLRLGGEGFTDYMWRFLKDKNTPDESLIGTDVRITGFSLDPIVITFNNVTGVLSYDIERCTDLMSGIWELVESDYPAQSGTQTEWTDPDSLPIAFYRVKVADAVSLIDGEDYITLWNQSGIAWHELARGHNPEKAYVYLTAKFDVALVGATYQTSTLTVESYHGISQFPFYVYQEGAPAMQMAYEHINEKMDQYFQTGEKRLIESYSDPYPPGPSGSLEGVAFTYDNALAICAYMARPTEENLSRARLLITSLIWAQNNDSFADGRLRDAYDATQEFTGSVPPLTGTMFDRSYTGNIAWAINALCQYYKNAPNAGVTDTAFLAEVLQAAEDAGDFIHANFYDSSQSGYYLGFNSDGTTLDESKSTEHNIATYVAFSHLYDITGTGKWLTRANRAKDFVQTIAWVAADDRYICGLNSDGSENTDSLVADVNLLAVLALGDAQRADNDISETIEYVKETFETEEGVADSISIEGIDFGYNIYNSPIEPDGIWFEGTAQLAQAYKVAGNYGLTDNSDTYLESIKLAQYHDFWTEDYNENLTSNYKGIPAASKPVAENGTDGGITTGLDYSYFASAHIAPTAWFVATTLDYNMLWGSALDADVPSPGDNINFTADPATLINDNTYLENRYMPSGWMNVSDNMYTDPRSTDTDYGDTCFKIHFTGTAGSNDQYWCGLVWQEPEGEWNGGVNKGYDLTGATEMKFRAKASEDTLVRFYLGYAGDSCSIIPINAIEQFRSLNTSWQDITLSLEDPEQPGVMLDMSHVSNGFTIVAGSEEVDVYIDDIRYTSD
ncbi:MAG: hypothetical protein HQ572_02930 [Candidatus Omnitrophica bacterium]|nr:hypothetical protein [Candidatus Omnitrophota bacterium]